jgi:flagellar basal-body rod modification protein FlgD
MITATTSNKTTTPTTGGTGSSLPGGAMGKDQFLKLLVAQLQHQDPMNPMQGDQMAAQLAQFSSLEQLQQMNTTLSNQTTAFGSVIGAIQAGAAMGAIGHTITAIGDQVLVGGANGQTSVNVDLAAAGTSATVHIYNAAGAEVGTTTIGALKAGSNTIDISSAIKNLPDGTYTYAVDAKDAAGKAVAVQTYTTGKVDGVSSSAQGITLTIGGMAVPYANVVSVK